MFESIIRHGNLLAIGVLIICIFGVLAIMRVPVQMIPDLEVRVIRVETQWIGATPQDVEKEILIEQEEYLRNIPGLERMISFATTGVSRIELEFPFGTDINEALIRVNNALSQVTGYPENVDEPRIYTSSFTSNNFMFFRVEPLPGNPSDLDMDIMRDFVDDNVRTRMERVPGVSEVNVRGGAERQIQILVDPARLAERGITLSGLRDIIRSRNVDISGGDIDTGKRRYLLRTVGRFDDITQIKELIIKREGDSIVRLGDIAQVQLDHAEINSQSYINGLPVIFISVKRQIGSNVVEIKDAMMPVVEQISEQVLEPMGMQIRHTTDDVRYVVSSIKNVWENLSIGAFLATLVMFLFLRSLPATFVGAIGIPICTIAAFLGLLVAGRTINVISLAGVAFAIGMTLDNTIVVLESIERERRKGVERLRASVTGLKNVWTSVLASTLTTILVFMPVLFVTQEAGQLYSDIAVAISASIFISMMVAISVIPAASGRLPFHSDKHKKIEGGYRKIIVSMVDWLILTPIRRITVMVSVLLITGLVIIKLTPPAEYLPEGEEYKTFSTMIAPAGYNLKEMNAIAMELHDYFLPHLDADPKKFDIGEIKVPSLAYLVLWTQPQQLRMIVETTRPGDINKLMEIIDSKYREYPGMRAFSTRGSIISSNDGGTRSVNVDITGAHLLSLYETSRAVYEKATNLFDNPSINSDPGSLILAQPLIEIQPDWERIAELNLSVDDVGYAVSAMTNGTYVDEFFIADDKIDMFMYNVTGEMENIDDIRNIPLYLSNGNIIPLGSVTRVVETIDTDTIRRLNGRRTMTLNIIPPRSVALETAVNEVKTEILEKMRSEGEIPEGISMQISGAIDQLEATRVALMENFFVAIILCYLLLVAIFNHWGYPLIIMTTVPLGIAGGIVGLWLLNAVGSFLPFIAVSAISQPFDMITMLGFLILVGAVVNNPILMLDRAITNFKQHGMIAHEAVRNAVEARLRPILMSMITTVCGLAPLVFIPGAGTELYRGVGAIVLFGLFFATLVTLLFLPSLLVTVLGFREAHTIDKQSNQKSSR
ncbi:MAG: efflux RND transporter permease subunit [Gammaproteobacteria bacterium]|nr:MMPL family transporter [Gammaproteobacteria bacterium]NIN63097.1 MMPL family transporter [Gammaproteobacteria bacterium]NIO61535.1 MMPL family transporter [Gammaproteobacteria bacterium]NIQ10968.1 efflux RND transporter permease subunit [Gammaproteobacteria bacterium]NIQ20714.1 MMPL family transporter [Gammaproteobacteria bacterium]